MIDDTELNELVAIHSKSKNPSCIVDGDRALVHSPLFVLELPRDEVKTKEEWPGTPLEFIRQWKYEQLSQTEGEVAQPMRTRWMVDDEPFPVIQLLSDSQKGFISPEIYEFIKRQVENPVFKLYADTRSDGSPANVGVFSGTKVVGVIAQILKQQ